MTASKAQINVVEQVVRAISQSMYDASWRTLPTICSAAGFAHLYTLFDDEGRENEGYWFVKDERNLFEYNDEKERKGKKDGGPPPKKRTERVEDWLFQGMIEQLTFRTPEDVNWRKELMKQADLFICRALDSAGDIKPASPEQIEAFRAKLQEIKQIEKLLACLIHLTMPGPWIDLPDIRHVNREAKRNLFIKKGIVTLVPDQGAATERYMPWIVGELVVRYLVVFRPLQQLLKRHFPNESDRLDTYMLAYRWTKEKLKKGCTTIIEHYKGGCDYDGWRQTYICQSAAGLQTLRYERWLSGPISSTEVYEFQKQFEFNTCIDILSTTIYLKDFSRCSILPYRSTQLEKSQQPLA